MDGRTSKALPPRNLTYRLHRRMPRKGARTVYSALKHGRGLSREDVTIRRGVQGDDEKPSLVEVCGFEQPCWATLIMVSARPIDKISCVPRASTVSGRRSLEHPRPSELSSTSDDAAPINT